MLLRELGRGVDVAGVERGVLVDRARARAASPSRVERVEPAGVEVAIRAARRGRDRPVGSAVGALAVDDHRGGDDEPADARAVHRGEQHGGAELVRRDVVGRVRKSTPRPTLAAWWHDRVDAVERRVDAARSRTSPHDEIDARIGRRRPRRARRSAGSRARARSARRPARLDDGAADEAGAAGDEQRLMTGPPGRARAARAPRRPRRPGSARAAAKSSGSARRSSRSRRRCAAARRRAAASTSSALTRVLVGRASDGRRRCP